MRMHSSTRYETFAGKAMVATGNARSVKTTVDLFVREMKNVSMVVSASFRFLAVFYLVEMIS